MPGPLGLPDEAGANRYLVGIFLDITDQKKLEQNLAGPDQREKMQEKLANVGELAAGLAHEINNPLTVIQSLAFLQKNKDSNQAPSASEMKDSATKILKHVDRISKIVSGLRNLGQPQVDEKRSEKSVNQLIHQAVEQLKPDVSSQKIDLLVEPLPSDSRIFCNEQQIVQVLINLLSNAENAVDSHKVKWIRIKANELDRNHVEIEVTDSGRGVPPDLRDKIFEPFFSTKPANSGTGLGLAVSRNIAEEHGGELILDPNIPNTTFRLRMPRLEVKQP
ncbi:MAG: sensor histidine kinase [Bdellovibrionales bacterium]